MLERAAISVAMFVLVTVQTYVAGAEPFRLSREDVVARMKPYDGDSVKGVSCDTMTGRVLCGYQGWFTAPGDGSGKGWAHYEWKGAFRPGSCCIDLWPDTSELDADEKFETPFQDRDGKPAHVFSSRSRKTVLRHFRWMQEYGIDGVFVQRFAIEVTAARELHHRNVVLAHCREGANVYGRAYALMYDLTSLPAGQIGLVIDDWKLLVDRMRLGRDARDHAYLRHNGKPVVAVWGVGFNDNRKYTLAESARLIDFLKNDKSYGNNTVLLGVPTGWRTLDADAVGDKALHDVLLSADVISPWTVGRFDSPQAAVRHAEARWKPDLEWCRGHRKEYLPVVFPGFSWHNMNPDKPLGQIPRLKGQFLWSQFVAARNAGATMLYQAMFDEMDEGTAIFKCNNRPPIGESKFVVEEDVPSDHYLWLVGLGGRVLRGEIKATDKVPTREK
jgi:hypothetical protein